MFADQEDFFRFIKKSSSSEFFGIFLESYLECCSRIFKSFIDIFIETLILPLHDTHPLS